MDTNFVQKLCVRTTKAIFVLLYTFFFSEKFCLVAESDGLDSAGI